MTHMKLSPEDSTFLGKVTISDLPVDTSWSVSQEGNKPRVAFIHRKQDRFTFTVRYFYVNTNNSRAMDGGEPYTYSKWRTLNTISFTLNKAGKLNVFFSGAKRFHRKTHRVTGVINITRQPFILFHAFGYNEYGKYFQLLIDELKGLYARNGFKFPEVLIPDDLPSVLLTAAYPSWTPYRGKSGAVQNTKLTVPPLFATDVFRCATKKEVANLLLTAKDTVTEKRFLSYYAKYLNESFVFALMLGKKRVGSDLVVKLFDLYERRSKNYSSDDWAGFNLHKQNSFSSLSFKDLMLLRSLFKLLPERACYDLLVDVVDQQAPMYTVVRIIEKYRKIKPELMKNHAFFVAIIEGYYANAEKNGTFDPVFFSWNRLETSLNREFESYFKHKTPVYYDANPSKPAEWNVSFYKYLLQNNRIWKVSNFGIVTAKSVGSERLQLSEDILNSRWNPSSIFVTSPTNMRINSSRGAKTVNARYIYSLSEQTFLAYNFSVPYVTKKTLYRNYYYSVAKRLNLEHLYQSSDLVSGVSISLSEENYKLYVAVLIEDAKKALKRVGWEESDENISFHIALVHLFNSKYNLFQMYRGFVPPKVYKLLDMGFSLNIALELINGKVSLETAKDFLDLPDSMILATLGVETYGDSEFF